MGVSFASVSHYLWMNPDFCFVIHCITIRILAALNKYFNYRSRIMKEFYRDNLLLQYLLHCLI